MHPQLVLPVTSAIVGLPVIVFLSWLLFKNWPRVTKARRTGFLVALSVLEAVYALAIYAFFIEPNSLVIHRQTIVSEHWHGPPLTIAAIGDLHVNSPHVRARRVGRVVARINALRPDLVVLLGDYMNTQAPAAERSPESRAEISNAIATFGALDSRYGVVSVLGNRDFNYGRTEITDELERAGVAVLWNRHTVIARSSGRFVVAGLADSRTARPDFAQAIDGAPANADIIVLAHNPDAFPEIPDNVALTLAAHTHCGQATIPFIGRPWVRSRYGQRYACHLVDEGGRKLFVTAGIGTSSRPVRFLNPPEIALITLRAAKPEQRQRTP